MTSPRNELLSLATPYALHAMTDAEIADIDRQLADTAPDIAESFAAEVRAVRETMATLASVTATEPPADGSAARWR